MTVLFLTFSLATANAADLGAAGRVYSIAEPDLVEAIKKMVAEKHEAWEKAMDKNEMEKKYRNYRPSDLPPPIPAAERDARFTVSLSYTLDRDVPDGKGGVLYPAGFEFNPLDYQKLPNSYVLIDGTDARQVRWLEKSPHYGDVRTRVMLTAGSYWDAGKELRRQVYYAPANLVEKARVKRVPSIIRQVGNLLEVTEVGMKPEGKK